MNPKTAAEVSTSAITVESSAIRFDKFSFMYTGSNFEAVRDVTFDIRAGEVVALAGHSGCGKSTLLRSINGLIPHMYQGEKSGKVVVDELDVDKTSIVELSKRVGFVFQNPENQIFMFSVERDVGFGLENLALPRDVIKQRVRWALFELGIADLAEKAPHELSDGQKQRVAIAGVLAMQPSVLILDEPTSLLDPATARELIRIVSNLNTTLGLTVIIVEHRLDLVLPIASRLVVMGQGRIIKDGSPNEVIADPQVELSGVTLPTVSKVDLLLNEIGGTGAKERVSLSPQEIVAKVRSRIGS